MHVQGLTATSELKAGYFDTTVTLVVEDRFATVPMLTAVSAYQLPNEEELHTSFEQAISDRLFIVNKQLRLRSGSLAQTQGLELRSGPLGQFNQADLPGSVSGALPTTAPLQEDRVKLLPALAGKIWERSIIFACLALMLILAGFDLMGFLVMYIR
jgi:hypothetical protein